MRTTHVRRWVILAFMVAGLTVPVESLLLPAPDASDPEQAAIHWAAGLSPVALSRAASDLKTYPVIYRKGLVRALAPSARSVVLRTHIAEYIAERPDLSREAVEALVGAMALATPENLDRPSREARAKAAAIGRELSALIGRADAERVLYHLGPDQPVGRSAEPTRLKVANWLHGRFAAFAATFADCDCNLEFDGCGRNSECESGSGCQVDNEWPACGWLWMQDCDGKCSVLPSGGAPSPAP